MFTQLRQQKYSECYWEIIADWTDSIELNCLPERERAEWAMLEILLALLFDFSIQKD